MGCVVHASVYPELGKGGQPPPGQTNDASLGPRSSASTEDTLLPKMMSRCLSITSFLSTDGIARSGSDHQPLLRISTKSHLAIFSCKDNQWWANLNEKVVRTGTNDCLHLQNKCCVTINLFTSAASTFHLLQVTFGLKISISESPTHNWEVDVKEPQIGRLQLGSCFGAKWFRDWQFHILPLDKSLDCWWNRSWGPYWTKCNPSGLVHFLSHYTFAPTTFIKMNWFVKMKRAPHLHLEWIELGTCGSLGQKLAAVLWWIIPLWEWNRAVWD